MQRTLPPLPVADRVAPELADVFAGLPPLPRTDPETQRARFKTLMASAVARADGRVSVVKRTIAGAAGQPMTVRVLRPHHRTDPLPAVLYMHGGGFVYGELDAPTPMAADLCEAADAVVVDVHYRLAPEHPFPAGLDDCYAALCWLAGAAEELGVDPHRIGVTGASAGANLSAGVTLMARDRGGPAVAHQCLLIPCLDDRLDTPSAAAITDERIIDGPVMRQIWDAYLGPGRPASPYAAPARASDLRQLPPAHVMVCGLDPLRDEGLDYARRLAEADIAVTVDHVPGAWHFFEASAPHSRLARDATRRWLDAITQHLRG